MKFLNWLEKHNKIILYCSITAFLTYIVTCIFFIGTDGFEQWYLKHIIKNFYVEDVDDAILSNGAKAGMLESLGDEHTIFIPSDYGFDNFDMEISGEYSGIGISIKSEDKKVIVDEVFRNSPAELSGIKQGDILIRINDTDVSSMSATDISELIRYSGDNKVNISVLRDGKEIVFTEVEKGEIDAPSVEYDILNNNIGYMWISSFDATTNIEVEQALNDMKNINSLIIDVRDNPGGLLDVVLETLDLFLDEGVVLKVVYKGDRKEEFHSEDGKIFEKSIVVLTNENSASAAEIFAAAMSEREAATTIGKTTYGKGTVQSVFKLPHNTGANITVAKFYSPFDKSINKNGVEPQIDVDNPEIYKDIYVVDIPEGEDLQLNYALELLSK